MNKLRNKTLEEVATLIMGQSPNSAYYSEEQVGYKFLQGCAEFGKKYPRAVLYCTHPNKISPPNSILFSVRAPVGRINLADDEYCIGRGLAAIVAQKIELDYLYQYMLFKGEQLRNVSQGSTFEAINSKDLRQVSLRITPSRAEQTRIASVLSCTDRAIEQTEAIIAKQQLIKSGLMQDLLSKGIDEHGNIRFEATHEFKDSPLGRIPKEWDVVRLGAIKNLITSGPRGWAKYYSTEGALFLRIGNLTREHINLRLDNLIYVNPPETSEGIRTALEEDDVLISITADLGIIGVVPPDFGEAFINQHLALVRLDKGKILPRWVAHYLSGYAGQCQFQKLNESGAKAGLNLPTINQLCVAQPKDKNEQQFITDAIDRCVESIDGEKKTLTKYQSLKRGLMRDLLTGKVSTESLLSDKTTASV